MTKILSFNLVLLLVMSFFQIAIRAEGTLEINQMLSLARNGDAAAQYIVGEYYATGVIKPANSSMAAYWFLKSAEQGYVPAQFEIGYAYEVGKGEIQNPAVAIEWYKKAAEKGHATAEYNLGHMYWTGRGTTQRLTEAAELILKAALQGLAPAQSLIASFYYTGTAVPQDFVEGFAWHIVLAASGDKKAIEARDNAGNFYGINITVLAQKRSKELIKIIDNNKSSFRGWDMQSVAPPQSSTRDTLKANGSGSIISTTGLILTAAHVIEDSSKIKVVTIKGVKDAVIVAIDKSHDLAFIKIPDEHFQALTINYPSAHIRLGQSVSTIGFPNVTIQGFNPKVTKGEISSLTGIGDDPTGWQISVPVQSGNSGGPLLDENGYLIGVILSKLGFRAAKITGDLPQNVSYAVKSDFIDTFLDKCMKGPPYNDDAASVMEINGGPSKEAKNAKPSFEDMIEEARKSVVLILIY